MLPNACHGYRAAVCLRMSAWKLHQLRSRFYLFHLLAEWHWASYLTSLGHCLLVWEPGIQTEASSLWNVSEVMLTKNLGQLPGGDGMPLRCAAQVMRWKSQSLRSFYCPVVGSLVAVSRGDKLYFTVRCLQPRILFQVQVEPWEAALMPVFKDPVAMCSARRPC